MFSKKKAEEKEAQKSYTIGDSVLLRGESREIVGVKKGVDGLYFLTNSFGWMSQTALEALNAESLAAQERNKQRAAERVERTRI